MSALSTLKQVTAQIGEIKHSEDYLSFQSFLAGCQNAAISVGNIIEGSEGEDAEAVTELSQYCELLYQMLNSDSCDTHKLECSLERAISLVEVLPEKLEVVFLPYKASMWDSLESVWMAARDDENYDAYVIPIPYYDKNPDGSFREVHYEGDLYPDYVPITGYDKYDFATRHPDIIYIHNPYDECNYVTSVHPFFYSSKLKEYTEELVYIPYFVLPDINPDDEEAVTRMEHFCTVPGVFNANKVIVQSENIRQVYIKVLKKYLGEERAKELHIEDKIFGTGSPKLDKVVRTLKAEVQLPEKWERMIQKPDGKYKKVVLYNTSIAAFLIEGEKMLAKIKDVFEFFEKYQKEITLLWRPHPLLEATIETMKPELSQEYKDIVKQYQNENWGIYDDTADLNRAIAVSDAYYGDDSSLVQLYKETGKPIMIQNVNVHAERSNPV